MLQTVKDVVESLVNDDLIHEDRIGISKYYWCGALGFKDLMLGFRRQGLVLQTVNT